MDTYRRMALAVTFCATGLTLAACSAGITTATTATSGTPAATGAGSSPAESPSVTSSPDQAPPPSTPTPSPAVSGSTVSVNAPIGSFPIPHGAQVMVNVTCGKQIIIELTSVTPSTASSFYNSALPRDGYKITGNTLIDGSESGLPGNAAGIEFSGHGYKGEITALSNLGALASASPSDAGGLPSGASKNFLTVTLTPPGAAGCPS